MRNNRKTMSSVKLTIVVFIFVLVLGIYAKEINEGSTAGYFLDQEMALYQQRQFDYSVVKLDVLQLERDLRQKANENRFYRYDHADRVVTVTTRRQDLAVGREIVN